MCAIFPYLLLSWLKIFTPRDTHLGNIGTRRALHDCILGYIVFMFVKVNNEHRLE